MSKPKNKTGSNSEAVKDKFSERYGTLQNEKKQLAEDMKELAAEIKEEGFDAEEIALRWKLRNDEKTVKKFEKMTRVAGQLDMFAGQETAEAA